MKNEIKKKIIGKIDDADARARTPRRCPRKMAVNVPDADCSVLAIISGIRNTNIVRQIGLESSIAGPRLMPRAFARKDVPPAPAKQIPGGD
jgi:hypothetical protein